MQPLSLSQSLVKYLKILRISLVERLVYRGDFLLATVFRFLPLITTFLLWDAVYTSRREMLDRQGHASEPVEMSGFSLQQMTAYLLLVQISRMFSSMPGLASGLARDIRDGNIKKYLLQPIDLLAYLLAYRGAHKIAYIITSSLPYAVLFFFFRDVFPGWPSWGTLGLYALSLMLGFVIGFFFEACVGLAGFWFLEVTSFIYIIGTLNFFVSGHMFPLDLLDPSLTAVLKYLPFQYLAYFPAMVFLEMKSAAELTEGFIIEATWAASMIVLAKFLYWRGLKRYSAFGG